MRTYRKPSPRLPDTRFFPYFTKQRLLSVWKDIIYEIKHVKPNTNNLEEQYFAYMCMVYAYLVARGATPTTKYLSVTRKGSFTHLDGFKLWVNTARVRQYLSSQHLVNNGNYPVYKEHKEKFINSDHVFVVDTDTALGAVSEGKRNRYLEDVLFDMFEYNMYDANTLRKKDGFVENLVVPEEPQNDEVS